MEGVALGLPDGRQLAQGQTLALVPGQSVVVTGRSVGGKSTLFRALAWIWPFGRGTVERPAGTHMFLPQRPYFPLGTLREVVAYPASPERFGDDAIRAALADVGLPALASRLD